MKTFSIRRSLILCAISATLFSGMAMAQESTTPDNTPIFGSQIMTEQERIEHRAKMRTASSAEAREQVRAEHHKQMLERATERGVKLPEDPPQRMMGQGRNQDKAPGMGGGRMQGAGQGQGMGAGRMQGAGQGQGQGQGRY